MIKTILLLDPRTWLFGWAVWSALQGVALLGPGDVFDAWGSFYFIHHWFIHGWTLGCLMMFDGLVLLAVLFAPGSKWAGFATVSSAAFWMAIGAAKVGAGIHYDYFSAVGLWCIFGSAKLILSSAQLGRRLS
jgi:hypothetical protein